jgi:MFS family permease
LTTTQAGSAASDRKSALLTTPAYWYYVLGLLTLCYVANVMDRSTILAASLQAIKREFGASDFQMGALTGLPFAIFYSTLGIPIAAWADRSSRRKVLAIAVALWSGATAMCGLAIGFAMLFGSRVLTAIGEAGGSPPSHSLISDYFPKLRRGTAFSILALAVPIGTSLGSAVGGWGNQHFGWRMTFVMAGAPGLLLALLVRFTVIEPPRGFADAGGAPVLTRDRTPSIPEALAFLMRRASFRHLCIAAALHSVVWYAGGAFNNAFLQRSHHMPVAQAGYWISMFAAIGGVGTFLGGFLTDRLSHWTGDRRWYMWLPGIATLLCVPFQFGAYLSPSLSIALPSFALMMCMAAVFFGPSFAMTQALATLRMRSVATSILLFVQTLIGQGIGPATAGFVSDHLMATAGTRSLGYALVIVGMVNLWAAVHYVLGARSLRADLQETEALAAGAH